MTCLSCHMQEVVAPVVTGGPPRARMAHRWAGGHSKRMLQKALRMESRLDGDLVKVRVTNAGAGHKVPTDARHRGIYVRIAFFDQYGQPVRVTTMDPLTQREVSDLEVNMDVIRLFYRHEQREPTQIPPAGTIGKDNWRDSEFPIPEGAKGGRVRLRLYYLLNWSWPMRKGTLIDEQEIRLGGETMSGTALILFFALAGDLAGAEAALEAGKPERALELLGDLADKEGAELKALLVSGKALIELRQYEGAMDPLLRAADRAPEDKEVARLAAWACWGAARGGGNFARAYLEDALRYARRAEDQRMIADLLFELGTYEEALQAYRALPATETASAAMRTRIAQCLAALGKEAEARAAYGEALDAAIAAEDLSAAFRSAFAAKQAGKLLAWLGTRIEAKPDDLLLRLHRGYAREGLGMWKEAAEDLKVAYRLEPRHTDARRRLARCLMNYGTREQQNSAIDEAEVLARAALKDDPRDPISWETVRWLAGWAWANRDVPRSFELLGVLHDIDPEARDIALNYCAMARRLGKYEEAEAAFLAILKVDDEDNDVLNDYAILKDGMGQEEEALRMWRRVLEIAPDDLNALENLYTKAWERGDAANARKHLARGLELSSAGGNEGLARRWRWFRNRERWAPVGHRAER